MRLPESIRNNIRALVFSRSHGLELLRLPTADLQETVVKRIKDHLTIKQTRQLVDSLLNLKVGEPTQKKKSSLSDPLAEYWQAAQTMESFQKLGFSATFNTKIGWTLHFQLVNAKALLALGQLLAMTPDEIQLRLNNNAH